MTKKRQDNSDESEEETSSKPNVDDDSTDAVTKDGKTDAHESMDGDLPDTPDDQEISEDDNKEDSVDLKDQLRRALAETENVRRRAKKEVGDATRFAIANFARDMLSVSDNMSRAIESLQTEGSSATETVENLLEGIKMTAREMTSVLERHGIKEINPLGEKFDYNYHQAMFEKSDGDVADGIIIEVVQVGYLIGERLLRPAMVGVAKATIENNTDKNHSKEMTKEVDTADEKSS